MRRTDTQRRADLRLRQLRRDADQLGQQRDAMLRELAGLRRRPGASRADPAAVELEAQLWPVIRGWEAVCEQLRAPSGASSMTLTERKLNGLRAQRVAARKAIEWATYGISDFLVGRQFIERQQGANWRTDHPANAGR